MSEALDLDLVDGVAFSICCHSDRCMIPSRVVANILFCEDVEVLEGVFLYSIDGCSHVVDATGVFVVFGLFLFNDDVSFELFDEMKSVCRFAGPVDVFSVLGMYQSVVYGQSSCWCETIFFCETEK